MYTELHLCVLVPKENAPSVVGTNPPDTSPPILIISLPAPSPRLILPVAVIVPLILILPVPTMSLLFKSKFPPSCGVTSSTTFDIDEKVFSISSGLMAYITLEQISK